MDYTALNEIVLASMERQSARRRRADQEWWSKRKIDMDLNRNSPQDLDKLVEDVLTGRVHNEVTPMPKLSLERHFQ